MDFANPFPSRSDYDLGYWVNYFELRNDSNFTYYPLIYIRASDNKSMALRLQV